ncbi:MAG: hypothetical protein AAB365_02385 [Patescibacteria group bacterium]
MKKTESQKPLIDWTLLQIATGLNVTVEGLLKPSERNGPEADGRKLAVHLLKDLIGIRPVSQLLPLFSPDAQNTGALYGIAGKGKDLAKKSKYKALSEDIVERAKKFTGTGATPTTTAAPTKPVAAVHRSTKPATSGADPGLAQDVCICALIEAGIAAEQVADGFGVPIESVYTAVGRLTITDAQLVQKIRAATKPVA